MHVQNQNDIFHISLSKWKVWTYTFFCWTLACLPLFITLLFIESLFNSERGFTSGGIIAVAISSTIFLIIAAIPFMFLTMLNKPMATITRNGFSGWCNLKKHSYAWTPDTVLANGGKNTILANLDASQSRASKLLSGPKAKVIVHHFFAKQKYQDILEAVERLSPYPVKQMSMLDAAKH